jgi:hypothetical protein
MKKYKFKQSFRIAIIFSNLPIYHPANEISLRMNFHNIIIINKTFKTLTNLILANQGFI